MTKQSKKNLIGYVLSNLSIYGFALMFGLLSMIFIIDKIPSWIKFVISFVFIAPTAYILFVRGRTQGERLFKEHAQTTLSDIHSEQPLVIPVYKCVYHVIGFVAPIILLLIIAVALKNVVVQFIAVIFEFPVALMFMSVGALDMANPSWVTLLIFCIYTLLLAGTFVFGYLLSVFRLKKRHADIKGELRMFDN